MFATVAGIIGSETRRGRLPEPGGAAFDGGGARSPESLTGG